MPVVKGRGRFSLRRGSGGVKIRFMFRTSVRNRVRVKVRVRYRRLSLGRVKQRLFMLRSKHLDAVRDGHDLLLSIITGLPCLVPKHWVALMPACFHVLPGACVVVDVVARLGG